MSLDNAFSREELDRWAQRAVRELGEKRLDQSGYLCELKVDGLAIDAGLRAPAGWYAPQPGATGASGEDVTATSERSRSSLIGCQAPTFQNTLEVRGEVYFAVADFTALNESLVLSGKPPFANPRNAAAGSAAAEGSEGYGARNLGSSATASASSRASPQIGSRTRMPPWIAGDFR